MVKYEMLGLAAKYGLSNVMEGLSVIKDFVWSCFCRKFSSLLCFRVVSFYYFMCSLYICTRVLHTVRIQ